MAQILVNGEWQQLEHPDDTLLSANPAAGRDLTDVRYPVSGFGDLEAMLHAAHEAVVELRTTPPEKLADFLDAYADLLHERKNALIEMAHTETALPAETRFPGELNRTTDQLRQAANAARERTWVQATIDTETNIRSMYEPLSAPVIVFGPNNFPLAFNGVSGGDFAAAIAAGNPVIAKANPAHPGTTKLLAEAALDAIKQVKVPKALVQMFYHTSDENGLKLVAHPLTGATAFTGSKAGLHLKRAADEAGKLIYLEMSSVNPVFVLPGAIKERADAIADDFFTSAMLGTGQFCTNPGLVFLLQSDDTQTLLDAVRARFNEAEPGVLLTASSADHIARGVQTWEQHGAKYLLGGQPTAESGYQFQNTLMTAKGADFIANPRALQTEVFGVASLFVIAQDEDELLEMTHQLEGNLTGCIYSDADGSDDDLYAAIAPVLRPKVGRLLNDKMPTGVAVVPSMVHGGPFPATGHPGFTAVGIPASLRRFAKLTCYDNVRHDRLPPELRDTPPNEAMYRYVDGAWVQQIDVKGA